MSTIQHVIQRVRNCVYCGKPLPERGEQCPHCREAVPKVRLGPAPTSPPSAKSGQMRRGILYLVLGLVVHFIALRSDSLNLPFSVHPAVGYLSAMLILGGIGLALYGFFSRVTA